MKYMKKLLMLILSATTFGSSGLLVVGCGSNTPSPSAVTVIQNDIRSILMRSRYGDYQKTEPENNWELYAPITTPSSSSDKSTVLDKRIIRFMNPTNLTETFNSAASYFTARLFRQKDSAELAGNSTLKPIDGYLPLNLYPTTQSPNNIQPWTQLQFTDPNSTNKLVWSFQYGESENPSYIPDYMAARTQLNRIVFLPNDFVQIYNKYPLPQAGYPGKFSPAFIMQTIATPINEYAAVNIDHSLNMMKSDGTPLVFSKAAKTSPTLAVSELWKLMNNNKNFPFLINNYNLFFDNVTFGFTFYKDSNSVKINIYAAGNSKSITMNYEIR